MNKKIMHSIIVLLIISSIALFAYMSAQYFVGCFNLKQYNGSDIYIENVPSIYDTKEPEYMLYDMPETRGFKSYMDYRKITSVTSPQYILQHNYAYTGNYGIRMVGDRYCIAVGSHFTTEIGQYIDLILANGTVIPCVLGDQKSDRHTDDANIITLSNGCASEFIVDIDSLDYMAKICGNISYCTDEWQPPVVRVKVYDRNVFDE